jgi:hypothetical protein
MIQRIQSVFLLIAFALMTIVLFVPYGNLLLTSGDIIDFKILSTTIPQNDGTLLHVQTLPLAILVIICALLSLISLLLFKKRMLQIRLSFFNIILMLGSVGLMYYYLKYTINNFSIEGQFNILMVFPIIAAILTFLAIRAIGKDEALVKSLDRIR